MSSSQDFDVSRMLEEMRADYWRNLEKTEGDEHLAGSDYLVIRLGEGRYGLPAAFCREVLKPPPLIRVPRLPRHLPGIFNLRGEIVAITDLRLLLGLEAEPCPSARLVVVEGGGFKTALLVDRVDGLCDVADSLVEPLARGAGEGFRDLLRGKFPHEDSFLILIDLQRLMQRPELIVDQKVDWAASSGPVPAPVAEA